jgi:hypothetical protein
MNSSPLVIRNSWLPTSQDQEKSTIAFPAFRNFQLVTLSRLVPRAKLQQQFIHYLFDFPLLEVGVPNLVFTGLASDITRFSLRPFLSLSKAVRKKLLTYSGDYEFLVSASTCSRRNLVKKQMLNVLLFHPEQVVFGKSNVELKSFFGYLLLL